MKAYTLHNYTNKAIDDLEKIIEDYGFSKILRYEEVNHFIYSSFKFDKKNNCIWIIDIQEVMEFALNLTFIEEWEWEEFMMEHLLKIKV